MKNEFKKEMIVNVLKYITNILAVTLSLFITVVFVILAVMCFNLCDSMIKTTIVAAIIITALYYIGKYYGRKYELGIDFEAYLFYFCSFIMCVVCVVVFVLNTSVAEFNFMMHGTMPYP